MDRNHRDIMGKNPLATEDQLWLPPLSPKDQETLNRLRKHRAKANTKRIWFSSRSVREWLNVLGVLAVPFVVTLIGIFYTQQMTQQQALASAEQHQIDLRIAQDQERETTLKTYVDDMSDLLLNHHLREAKPGDEVREVAREQTLTALRRLDAGRNRIVLQFLQDAHLISGKNAVIDFYNADLSNDDLSGANLDKTNFSFADLFKADLHETSFSSADLNAAIFIDANLSEAFLTNAVLTSAVLTSSNLSGAYITSADLTGADLGEANLRGAYLAGATLWYANLSGADLTGADLRWANLSGANLTGADLRWANLNGANLRQTIITREQLAEVRSLAGAIMPDGSKHP